MPIVDVMDLTVMHINKGNAHGTQGERSNGDNSNEYLLLIFFQLNTLKGTAKASALDLLRLNVLKGVKTAVLILKSYDDHPSFLYESFYPGLVIRSPLVINIF